MSLQLADQDFGCPGRIDILLGVDVYVESLSHGRRSGRPGSPVAFETIYGCVLSVRTNTVTPSHFSAATHHMSVNLNDDILHKFWEIEELQKGREAVSIEEKCVLDHFKATHQRNQDGRFKVPLPRRSGVQPLGESRSQAI